MIWGLPSSVDVGGVKRKISTEYRDILRIIKTLTDLNEDDQVRVYVSMALFYPEFSEIPEREYQDAAEKMIWFISCGEEDGGEKHPKLIDWEQDYSMIVSDINKVAGTDVRGPSPIHWWTFVSMFNGIGEGQLSTVVSIRDKIKRGKKLEKWEQEFLKKNRSRVILKTKYTKSEEDILKKWTGKG